MVRGLGNSNIEGEIDNSQNMNVDGENCDASEETGRSTDGDQNTGENVNVSERNEGNVQSILKGDDVGNSWKVSDVGIGNRGAVVGKFKGIDDRDVRNVGLGVEELINDFKMDVTDEHGGNGYHNVKVAKRVDNNDQKLEKFVDYSKMRDNVRGFKNIDIDNRENVDYESINRICIVGKVNTSSHSGEYDISSVNSDKFEVDSREVKLGDTNNKVEGRSKFLEMLRCKSVKYDSPANQTTHTKGTGDLSLMVLNIEAKVGQIAGNKTDNDKTKDVTEKKVNRNIHRSLDEHMETLKYLYYEEAEKFWNEGRSKYTKNYQIYQVDVPNINITADIKTEDTINKSDANNDSDKTENETINDLVNNFKDCNIKNDKKPSRVFYTHPNANSELNRSTQKQDGVNSCLIKENIEYTSQSSVRGDTGTTDISKSYSKLSDKEMNNIALNYNIEDFDLVPQSSTTEGITDVNTKMYTSRNVENQCLNNTYHTNVIRAHTSDTNPYSSKWSEEEDLVVNIPDTSNWDSGRQCMLVGDLNKENVIANVKSTDTLTDFNKVDQIDDGTRLRSAVLLRKLEQTKTT